MSTPNKYKPATNTALVTQFPNWSHVNARGVRKVSRPVWRGDFRKQAAVAIFERYATVTANGTFYQSDMPRRARRLMARRRGLRMASI